jgi:hypothetical protein
MKNRIFNIIGIIMILSLVMGYAWLFDSCFEEQMKYNREIEKREYIRWQRDSIQLEILKKNMK